MTRPLLFCFDGSEGSSGALRAAADLLARPSSGYVLTVWQPTYLQLANAGAFATAVPNEGELDEREAAAARQAAEAGARLGAEHGYDLEVLVERADTSVAETILAVARRIEAGLIICGQRGRGPIRTAVFGSVSHHVAAHAHIPVLISPEAAGS